MLCPNIEEQHDQRKIWEDDKNDMVARHTRRIKEYTKIIISV